MKWRRSHTPRRCWTASGEIIIPIGRVGVATRHMLTAGNGTRARRCGWQPWSRESSRPGWWKFEVCLAYLSRLKGLARDPSTLAGFRHRARETVSSGVELILARNSCDYRPGAPGVRAQPELLPTEHDRNLTSARAHTIALTPLCIPAGCGREQRYREAIAESICDGAASRGRIGHCATNEPKRVKIAGGGDKGSDRSGDQPRSSATQSICQGHQHRRTGGNPWVVEDPLRGRVRPVGVADPQLVHDSYY